MGEGLCLLHLGQTAGQCLQAGLQSSCCHHMFQMVVKESLCCCLFLVSFFRKEKKWKRGGGRRGGKGGSGGRKEESGGENREKKRTQRGGQVKMRKEKCVVCSSQLLGPWRRQAPCSHFRPPRCPLAQVQLGVDFSALEEPLADLAHD